MCVYAVRTTVLRTYSLILLLFPDNAVRRREKKASSFSVHAVPTFSSSPTISLLHHPSTINTTIIPN